MSEDLTRNLPPTSFEERVLNELAAMRTDFNHRFDALDSHLTSLENGLTSLDGRLTSLEDKVDARLRETRPIWEGVQQRLTEIEAALKEFNRQMKTLITDSFKLRARV
jgi:predicted  nucleic acid-binding Zn-ribbon protein